MFNTKEIRAQRSRFFFDHAPIEITVFDEKEKAIAEPLIMRKVNEFSEVLPMLKLRDDQAQVLMDDLWNCGIRPTEGMGSAGSLAATDRHLQDMRTLVFKEKSACKYPDLFKGKPATGS